MKAEIVGVVLDPYQGDPSKPTYFRLVGEAGEFKFSTRRYTAAQLRDSAVGKTCVLNGTLRGRVFSQTDQNGKRGDAQALEWESLDIKVPKPA